MNKNYVDLLHLIQQQLIRSRHNDNKKHEQWMQINQMVYDEMLRENSLSAQLKIRGIKQTPIARHLHIGDSTLSLYLTGRRTMPEYVEKYIQEKIEEFDRIYGLKK